jgi:hypothetical protein
MDRAMLDFHGVGWMKLRLPSAVVPVLLVPMLACAAPDSAYAPSAPPPANAPGWSFSATGMYYSLRDQSDFLLVTAAAERGPLHLEARHNYEALDASSLFVGWKFSGGESLTYALTPILGVVFGATQGIAPGFEASAAYGAVDFYTEAEYVHDTKVGEDSFTYAWSELGYSPRNWLRFGLVGQRTRVYKSDREIQRGVFGQAVLGEVTLGLYVFNPDDSADRVVILSLGAKF